MTSQNYRTVAVEMTQTKMNRDGKSHCLTTRLLHIIYNGLNCSIDHYYHSDVKAMTADVVKNDDEV